MELAVFVDFESPISRELFVELERVPFADIRLVVNSNPLPPRSKTRKMLDSWLNRLFNPAKPYSGREADLKRHCFEYPFVHWKKGNTPEVLRRIGESQARVALLLGCPHIVPDEMLRKFKRTVNYHNSLLPKYRGLYATNWAMYFNEKICGFTFHEATSTVDDGKIFMQKKIRLDYEKSAAENEIEKTRLAAQSLGELLDLLEKGYEGVEQEGEASYYGNRERLELLTLSSLNDIEKTKRLLDIWGHVLYKKGDEVWEVTEIDGEGKIVRVCGLPPSLYRLYVFLVRVLNTLKSSRS